MGLLILIPARTGSKGIHEKNFIPMLGNPLWAYALNAATLTAEYLKERGEEVHVCISTDDPSRFPAEVAQYVIQRPNEYATDTSPVIDTILDAILQVETAQDTTIDCVCLLQPTSPTRTAEDVIACIQLCEYRGLKHPVVSGYLTRRKEKGKTDSKANPSVFHRSGSVFVIPRSMIDAGRILDGEEYEMAFPKSRGIDIDDLDDWLMAESVLFHRMWMEAQNATVERD